MAARASAVGPLVFGMTGMPPHPDPADLVPRRRPIEPLPQIDVLDGLVVGGAPAAPLPVVDPFGDAVAQILAVAVEPYPATPFQRFEAHDRRQHLHAIVGCMRLRSAQLLLDPAVAQDRGPAARARIAAAGAVGEDLDLGRLRHRGRSRRAPRRCDESAAGSDIRAGPLAGPALPPAGSANRRAGSTESARRHRAPTAAARPVRRR